MSEPATADIPATIYRVGRNRRLLQFSQITPEDATLPRAGNRFDVPGGAVLYAGSTVEACYAETLARYRPSPKIREIVRGEDPGFMVAGGVPQDWRLQRSVAQVAADHPLPFLDVESPETLEFLSRELSRDLVSLGYEANLDFSDICNRDRRLSRAVAAHAYTASQADGSPLYSGIRYASRLNPQWECWAIFDGTEVRLTAQRAIELRDEDLKAVEQLFGLRIF